MRSQLFGFIVHTQRLNEFVLSCPLQQAYDLLVEISRLCEARFSRPVRHPLAVLGQTYTLVLEVPLNEWDEETEEVVTKILAYHALEDELRRMERLREGLTWRWSRIRDTMTLLHFILSITSERQTLLTLVVGWNEGADPADIDFTDTYIQLYFTQLQRFGINVHCLTQSADSTAQKRVRYGARLDTVSKLEALRKCRQEHRLNHALVFPAARGRQ